MDIVLSYKSTMTRWDRNWAR